MIFMKNTGKENNFRYDKVKITWWDICTCEAAWVNEEEILDHDISVCQMLVISIKRLGINYGYLHLILKMKMEWMLEI